MVSLKSQLQRNTAMLDNDFLITTIRNLMTLVRELEPDPEWREYYNVDEVMQNASMAIQMLNKGE